MDSSGVPPSGGVLTRSILLREVSNAPHVFSVLNNYAVRTYAHGLPNLCEIASTRGHNDVQEWLTENRSPMVKFPAVIGGGIVANIAIPLIVPSLLVAFLVTPVNLLIMEKSEADNTRACTIFAPIIVGELIGQYAFGVPCWMLFGRWWQKSAIQPNAPLTEQNEKTTSQTQNGFPQNP